MANVKASFRTVGSSVKNAYNSVKDSVKSYGKGIKGAYNVGYYSGVKDYSNIPKTFGARSSASFGYKSGLDEAHRNYKYSKKNK